MRSWGRFCVFTLLGMALLAVVGCGGGGKSIPPPPATYTIGGTVSGVIGTGLVLQDNGGNNLTVSVNATSFTFVNPVASGGAYNVTVLTQPTGQSCTVTNGSGTATANVTSVSVACVQEYTIGGPVLGLSGPGLVLQDNGGNNLTVSANATSYAFTFEGSIPSGGAPYSITVLSDPDGQACTVANASGTASASVTNASVTCSNLAAATDTIGGTVIGLSGTGLILRDSLGLNDDDLLPVDGNGNFTFANPVASGGTYSVTVLTQPAGQSCAVTNGSGTATANVANVSVACVGDWTWMGGSTTVGNGGQTGVYGTLGTPVSTNAPGGRYGAVTWSDASGNLWLFGGEGYDSNGALGYLNDVWKFAPKLGTNGDWAWKGGSTTVGNGAQPGVYGTQGVAASTNAPGGRYGAVNWSDASGNLWLYGGFGSDSIGAQGYLNDLWKFDSKLGTNGEWTWMGGSATVVNSGQPGVYGTQGVAASTNIPGGRGFALSWIDASGNLWLFGGLGYDSNGVQGYFNDLWEFDPKLGTNGEWTWMGGSNTVGNGGQPGVYGTQGVAASTNIPGGRGYAASWIDASGNLWLFGGFGFDSTKVQGHLNDMWKYAPSTAGGTGEWTWMGGSTTVGSGGQPGVYGTLGMAASTNIPGGRFATASWIDASGNLWLFGGGGYDSTGKEGVLNDVWKFTPSTTGDTGEWTWMGGSSTVGGNDGQSGVYGMLGVASPTNVPGGREYPMSAVDASGNLWLFGGLGEDSTEGAGGALNDLWEYPQ